MLSETGLPNRWYLPAEELPADRFVPSAASTHCPYKGDASYWTYRPGDGTADVTDVAWSYEKPFDDMSRIAGYRAFMGDAVTVEVAPR